MRLARFTYRAKTSCTAGVNAPRRERELLRRAGLIEGMESERSLKARYEIAT
jgi:hypothetical protein